MCIYRKHVYIYMYMHSCIDTCIQIHTRICMYRCAVLHTGDHYQYKHLQSSVSNGYAYMCACEYRYIHTQVYISIHKYTQVNINILQTRHGWIPEATAPALLRCLPVTACDIDHVVNVPLEVCDILHAAHDTPPCKRMGRHVHEHTQVYANKHEIHIHIKMQTHVYSGIYIHT